MDVLAASILAKTDARSTKLLMVGDGFAYKYAGLPHLLSAPVDIPEAALSALESLLRTMEERYSKLQKNGEYHIKDYNNTFYAIHHSRKQATHFSTI